MNKEVLRFEKKINESRIYIAFTNRTMERDIDLFHLRIHGISVKPKGIFEPAKR